MGAERYAGACTGACVCVHVRVCLRVRARYLLACLGVPIRSDI